MTRFHHVMEEMKLQRIMRVYEQEVAPHWMHSSAVRKASGEASTDREMALACSDKEAAS